MFTGKTAVITGGAHGIGRSIAQAFRQRNARVAVIDLQPVEYECEYALRGDIADPLELESFAQGCIELFGQVDYLIHNAMLSRGGLSTCSWEDFIYAQKVGVAAPYYLTRLLRGHLSPGASIVTISSTRAFQSQADTESYSAAKGGITALTHALAASLAGQARVNAVAPGWIDIKEGELSSADHAQHPAGRVGRPEDIAAAVLYLCSSQATFVNGQMLVVDGGMSHRMIYHGDEGWQFTP